MKKMHFNKQQNETVKNDKNILNNTNLTTQQTGALSIEAKVQNIRNTAALGPSDIETFTGTTSCTSSTDSGVNISDNETPPSPLSTPPQTPQPSTTIANQVNPFNNNQQYHKNNKNSRIDKNVYQAGDDDDDDDDDNRSVQTINNSSKFDKKFQHEDPQRREQQSRQQNQQLTNQFIKVENSSNENNYTPYQSNRNAIKSENVIINNKNINNNNNNSQHMKAPTTTAATTTINNSKSSSLQHNGLFIDPTLLQRSSSPSLSMSSTNSYNHPPSKMYHQGSPNVSIRSIDSSIIDSDSDSDLNGDVVEGVHENYVIKKLGTQVSYPPKHPEIPNINKGLTVLNEHIAPNDVPPSPLATLAAIGDSFGVAQGLGPTPSTSAVAQRPQIGSIALSNSHDVTFGDKHFYEGPVTIQQFLINGRDKQKENNGKDNPTFESDENYTLNNAKDINSSAKQSSKLCGYILKRKKYIIPGALAVMTLLIVAIILGSEALNDSKSKLVLGNSEESRKNIPINSTIAQDNLGGGNVLRLVPRDGWLAQPPVNPWVPLDLPVERVIIIPTRTAECETQAACTYTVRITQTFNIESQQQDDIIYNFLIGGDGNVYEGRGWENRGSAVKGFNDDSISLAYIGSFKKQKPSDKQLSVTKLLLEEGVRLDKLSSDYKIVGANKLDPTSTATSADALYKSFENWPHWSEN